MEAGSLNLNIATQSDAVNSPSSSTSTTPVGQLSVSQDLENRKLNIEIEKLKMELFLRNSELECLQRRSKEKKERFKTEIAELQKRNQAYVTMVTDQAENQIKYIRGAKMSDVSDLQKRFDELKTNYDEIIQQRKLLLEEYTKAQKDFDIEKDIRMTENKEIEKLKQLFQQRVLENENTFQENQRLLKANQEVEEKNRKLLELNRNLEDEKNELLKSIQRLEMSNSSLKNDIKIKKLSYEELRKAVDRMSVERAGVHNRARYIPSVLRPISSTPNMVVQASNENTVTPPTPGPRPTFLHPEGFVKRKYKHPRVELKSNPYVVNHHNSTLDRGHSRSSPSLYAATTGTSSEFGTLSSRFSPVVSVTPLPAVLGKCSKKFSFTHFVGRCSAVENSSIQAPSDILNSGIVEDGIDHIEATTSDEGLTDSDKENGSVQEYENMNDAIVHTDETLLEPLSTTLSIASDDNFSWRRPALPLHFSPFVFVRVYSSLENVQPRHFLAELTGEKADVRGKRSFKAEFFMKGRGKNNFTFSRNEAAAKKAKEFEIDEKNIVAYLPEPLIDRRGRYTFNFDFSQYRLGETPNSEFQIK